MATDQIAWTSNSEGDPVITKTAVVTLGIYKFTTSAHQSSHETGDTSSATLSRQWLP
jgi:hypothetical protein